MKKLIAIVITLILVFNGTGYCLPRTPVVWGLRPPLAFWKTSKIKTASINWDKNSESLFYYRLAKEKGLKGRAVDIGTSGNDGPAKGLIKGGISQVSMVDNVFPALNRQADGIVKVPGDATDLVKTFGEDAVEVAVFNQSLDSILEVADETPFVQELERDGKGQAENPFFLIDVLDRVISQAHAVLKPNGTLLIATYKDFIEGRKPAMLRGANLIESLKRHGFIDIEQRVIDEYDNRVIISAKKKGISLLDMAVKTRDDL